MKCRKPSKPTEAAAQHSGMRSVTTMGQQPYSCLQQQHTGSQQGGHLWAGWARPHLGQANMLLHSS